MIRNYHMPFGAELEADGRVRFRLWTPPHREVQIELDGEKTVMVALCCTDQQLGEVSPPAPTVHMRRTYSGRPSSSMRFSDATVMATSVVWRPPVRERSASPITRL